MVKGNWERRVEKAEKRKSAATTPEAIAAVDAETAQLHEDLEYVTNYPRAKKYVSLFPKGGLDEYGRGEVAKMRAEIKEIMHVPKQVVAPKNNSPVMGIV